jgi:hypothetical protein
MCTPGADPVLQQLEGETGVLAQTLRQDVLNAIKATIQALNDSLNPIALQLQQGKIISGGGAQLAGEISDMTGVTLAANVVQTAEGVKFVGQAGVALVNFFKNLKNQPAVLKGLSNILKGQPPLRDPQYSGPPIDPANSPSWLPKKSYGLKPARAISGEANAAFGEYSLQKGWRLLDGPGSHRWNAGGPDIVAFRFNQSGGIDLEIVDNKSFAGTDVSSVSSLTDNLEQNLRSLVNLTNDPQLGDVNGIAQVRATLQQALQNLANGQPMPSNMKLLVTNFGGNAAGLSPGVNASLPPGWTIGFRNIMP